jgi:hypothetical protein
MLLISFRLPFAIALPFIITPWRETVGIGWTFGMMAFFTLLGALLLLLLFWEGRLFRSIVVVPGESEDGERILKSGSMESLRSDGERQMST